MMKIVIVLLIVVAIISAGAVFVLKNRNTTIPNDTFVTGTTTPNTQHTGNPSDASVSVAREIVVEASEYKFNPAEVHVKKGETVKITLKNAGRMNHDWMVENMGGASLDIVGAGQTGSITLTPSQKGTFTTYCSVGNHRQMGMVGKLIVE